MLSFIIQFTHTFNNLNKEQSYKIKCLVTENSTGEHGTGEVTVLSFKVVDSFYRGTEGMTWPEWMNSGYVKTFPLNEEHYNQFLEDCYRGRSVTPILYWKTRHKGRTFTRNGLFFFKWPYPITNAGRFCKYDLKDGIVNYSSLVFWADDEDRSFIPNSPREHLRIFREVNPNYAGGRTAVPVILRVSKLGRIVSTSVLLKEL